MSKNSMCEEYHSIAEYIELCGDGTCFYYGGYVWGFLCEDDYKHFYGWNLTDGDWEDLEEGEWYDFPISIRIGHLPHYLFFTSLRKMGVRFVKYVCDFFIEHHENEFFNVEFAKDGKSITFDEYPKGKWSLEYKLATYILYKEKSPESPHKVIYRTTKVNDDE